MRGAGHRHYRLSVAWPRIVPEGDGAINPRGLDFYDRLIDALLARGITPWVTLFHWDLPQALEDRGGWLVRATVDAFRRYAETVVEAPGRPGPELVHGQRDPLLHRQGLRQRLVRPGAAREPARPEPGLSSRPARPRARRRGGARARRPGVAGRPGPQPPAAAADPRRPRPRPTSPRRRPSTSGPTASSWARSSSATTPTPSSARRAPTPRAVEPGDLELIAQPTDFLGLNLYAGDFVRAGRDGRPEVLPFPRQYPAGATSPGSTSRRRRSTGASASPPRSSASGRSSSPRTAPRSMTQVDARRRDPRPRPPRVPAQLPDRAPPGRRRRVRRPRLFRLVAAGQLRVGRGLRQAVRDRPRRLRHAGAHAQAQRPVVRGSRPGEPDRLGSASRVPAKKTWPAHARRKGIGHFKKP